MKTLKFKVLNDKAGDIIQKSITNTLREFQGFYDEPMELIRKGDLFEVTNLSNFMVDIIKKFDLKIK